MEKTTPKVKTDAKNNEDSARKSELSPFQLETILKKYNDDIKQHMSALSEDFQDKVAMVAEQVVGLHDKNDTLVDKIDGVETRLTDKIDGVIHVQETHTEMIGAIMEDVSEIKIKLKNKADKVEVARLERRMQSLV